MSWRCPICGTNNDASEKRCKVCGAYSPNEPTLPRWEETRGGQPAAYRIVIRIEDAPVRELIGATFTVDVPPTGGVITLGRSTDNTIIIPDPTVSRRHARIVVGRNTAILEDVGSRNGTYVISGDNEVRVSVADIGDDTLVRLGATTVLRIWISLSRGGGD